MRTSAMRYPPPGNRYPPPGHRYPPSGRPPGPPPAFSWMPYVIMGVILFGLLLIVPRMGWMGMMILFFVGIPIVKGLLNTANRTWAERGNAHAATLEDDEPPEKRKRRTYRASSSYTAEAEKPKRQPEYTVGDDGELVELDPAIEQEQARRSQNTREPYV